MRLFLKAEMANQYDTVEFSQMLGTIYTYKKMQITLLQANRLTKVGNGEYMGIKWQIPQEEIPI